MPPVIAHCPVSGTVTKTLLCLDNANEVLFTGRLFCPFLPEIVSFQSMEELLAIMEQFFNDIDFPQAFYTFRQFQAKEPPTSARKRPQSIPQYQDTALFDTLRGSLATLTVQVLSRHHASWQGVAQWVERDKSSRFESALELFRLVSAAARHSEDAWGNSSYSRY